jgi:hypothetical protein
MPTKRERLFARLEELGIGSTTVEHEPMFTVEQSQALRGSLPGAHTKNLFRADKDWRQVLNRRQGGHARRPESGGRAPWTRAPQLRQA